MARLPRKKDTSQVASDQARPITSRERAVALAPLLPGLAVEGGDKVLRFWNLSAPRRKISVPALSPFWAFGQLHLLKGLFAMTFPGRMTWTTLMIGRRGLLLPTRIACSGSLDKAPAP